MRPTRCYLHRLAKARRDIHLIDAENLIGDPRLTSTAVQRLKVDYTMLSPIDDDAHVVLATSAGPNLVEGAIGWGNCRLVFLPGPDGADRALLSVGEENLAARFSRIVIGSGDGIFADLAAALQAQGASVTVITRPGALSRRLRLAVHDIRFLPAYVAPQPARHLDRQTAMTTQPLRALHQVVNPEPGLTYLAQKARR